MDSGWHPSVTPRPLSLALRPVAPDSRAHVQPVLRRIELCGLHAALLVRFSHVAIVQAVALFPTRFAQPTHPRGYLQTTLQLPDTLSNFDAVRFDAVRLSFACGVLHQKLQASSNGIIPSQSDELEGRFPSGTHNLATNCLAILAFEAAAQAAMQANDPFLRDEYRSAARTLRINTHAHFMCDDERMYAYYTHCDDARGWACLAALAELPHGEKALEYCLNQLWVHDGVLTSSAHRVVWDRTTLYAIRAAFRVGLVDLATERLQHYAKQRLRYSPSAPFAVENNESWAQLSAESALFVSKITVQTLPSTSRRIRPVENWTTTGSVTQHQCSSCLSAKNRLKLHAVHTKPGKGFEGKMKLSTAATESGDDSESERQLVLTAAKASEFCPKHYRLIAPQKAWTHLDDISTLSSLDYVDLTGNRLTSLNGLRNNHRIKTLIVRGNNLSDLTPILKLSALRVLNIAENKFVSTDWLVHASFAGELVTLVANGNQIKELEGLSCLRAVKTLVLSHNCIENMVQTTALSSLTKLSLSNNEIRTIPDTLQRLRGLSEIRLAHNLISSLPSKVVLSSLTSLKILDLGHNRIESFEELEFVGNNIINLNIRNNPATREDGFLESIRKYCPKAEVIDGTRVSGGRRKLRVNRLRIAAGFPIENDRKFARPPPKEALDRLQKGNEMQSDDEKNQKQGNERNPSGRKEGLVSDNRPNGMEEKSLQTGKRKLASDDITEADSGKCLEPSDLIARARANVLGNAALKSLQNTSPQVQAMSILKQKRKRKKRKASERKESEADFGFGGSSKW
ncbi:unnamed protein product [Agarophyton chilense]